MRVLLSLLFVTGCSAADQDGAVDAATTTTTAEGGTCEPGTTAADPDLGTVVCIPSGTFTMGCVTGRDDVAGGCDSDESPSRPVELTRSFWMMEAEVTQAQYEAVVGTNPSYYSGPKRPVEGVNWDDAVAFADAVSVAQGLTPCGGGDPYTCDGWRLPTEAEWEYAARGDEAFPYAGSSVVGDVAWYEDNAPDGTEKVCLKAANGFGLCDMTGNVSEWTHDWFEVYPGTSSTDPTGPASGSYRAIRGGSYVGNARSTRVASRGPGWPSDHFANVGFRLVRSVP